MFATKSTAARAFNRSKYFPRFSIARELMIWNKAWQEYHRLQRLDAEDLADMGISRTARDAVTVSRIAARLRG